MKQYIVLVSCIVLGIFLFTLITGPISDSVRDLYKNEIQSRTIMEQQI